MLDLTHIDYSAGLNIEQRKRLTIGIELVAKPELLLFLGILPILPVNPRSACQIGS